MCYIIRIQTYIYIHMLYYISCIMLYHIMSCSGILCFYYIALCYIILYYIIFYFVLLYLSYTLKHIVSYTCYIYIYCINYIIYILYIIYHIHLIFCIHYIHYVTHCDTYIYIYSVCMLLPLWMVYTLSSFWMVHGCVHPG